MEQVQASRATPPRPRRRTLLLLAAALVLAACDPHDVLPTRRWTALEGEIAARATLHVDAAGRAWVGVPGALLLVDSGAPVRSAPIGGRGVPAVVGSADGRVHAAADGRLLSLEPASGRRLAERTEARTRALALDPRGRWLLQGAASGAVLAHEPATLEPVWAWPSLDREATALAVSPEGDRAYLAVAAPGGEATGAAQLLVRDLQTGRILSRHAMRAPLYELRTGADGTLYGLTRELGGAVVALRPGRGELRPRWDRGLRELGLAVGPDEHARLRVSPDGRRLVVVAPGQGGRLLDADAGRLLARLPAPLADAAFGPEGRLYLLAGSEVRVTR